MLHHSALNTSVFQRFGISSSASPQTNEKETSENKDAAAEKTNADAAANDPTQASTSGDTEVPEPKEETGSTAEPEIKTSQSVKRRRRGTKRTAFSDSDSDSEADLSMDDLVKLVVEKEELLKSKHKEIEKMQDKVLRTYAEMENVMDRTRREAENAKKFAIQVCMLPFFFQVMTHCFHIGHRIVI